MPPTIAILGAGPAGSAAAFHLARAGFPVTILEARSFPRVKVCGEFISPAATHLLEAILPPAALRAAGARLVDRFVLQLDRRERALRMPSPAWALSRHTLDQLLLARAAEAGARILQPAPVTRAEHGDDGVTLHRADGSTLAADIVLHADGHARLAPSPPTPTAPALLGHKCHFTPARPVDGVTIRSAPGAYIGTIQIEPHDPAHEPHATIALVARAPLLTAHKGNIDAMVRSLWPDWDPARRTTGWLSCGVARAPYQPSGHPRAFRVGNAAAAVDPVGGEGIGLALWSGTLLATLLAETAPTTTGSLQAIHHRYAAHYRARLRLRRPACHLAAECLMRPRLIAALWPLLGLPRLSLAPWYAATGKPLLPRRCPAAAPR